MNANDLQKWIDHLLPEEREKPICVSHTIAPSESDIYKPITIGGWMTSFYDGFIIVVEKDD